MKVFAGCRAIGPYLLIELILPGGSLVALLLWIYRTTRRSAPLGPWLAQGICAKLIFVFLRPSPNGKKIARETLQLCCRYWHYSAAVL
jgi:hypothetical protein